MRLNTGLDTWIKHRIYIYVSINIYIYIYINICMYIYCCGSVNESFISPVCRLIFLFHSFLGQENTHRHTYMFSRSYMNGLTYSCDDVNID